MSKTYDLTRRFKKSRYLSYFRKTKEDVYLYQDLFGYLLKMSLDLVEFIEYFSEERGYKETLDHFSKTYPDGQVLEFIDVFGEHGCLVSGASPQGAALFDMWPVLASWIIYVDTDDGCVEHFWGNRSGDGISSQKLDAAQSSVWRGIDSERTLREIVTELRDANAEFPDDDTVISWFEQWAHSERQLVKFSDKPQSYYTKQPHLRPPYLTSTMPYPRFDPSAPDEMAPTPDSNREAMDAYHSETISDPDYQFDVAETTVAHVFRRPHKCLGDRTYAGRLVDLLVSSGRLHSETRAVWEIGGGTGWFAHGFLTALRDEHPDIYATAHYTVLDLSPALQASQRKLNAEFADKMTFISGNAEDYDFPEESIGLVVANEMIGDLTTRMFTREQVGLVTVDPDAAESPEEAERQLEEAEGQEEKLKALGADGEMILRHGIMLDDAPHVFHLNTGAYRLVERLATAIRPGGAAVLIEFGELFRYPALSTHLDHPEFSIHWAHLGTICKGYGFEVDFQQMVDWFFVDKQALALATTQTYFKTLRDVLATRDIELEKIAYTRDMFAELLGDKLPIDTLHVLDFRPIGERTMGLTPFDFKALLLNKPGV